MSGDEEQRWRDAKSRARAFRALDRDEQDVLALLYYLIATEDAVGVDQVPLRAVRYRLGNPPRLRDSLARLLPGPEHDGTAQSTESGLTELNRARLADNTSDNGPFPDGFAGPPPVQGRIWRLWHALQARHGVPLEDTLPSDMVTEAAYGRFWSSGESVVDHALHTLTRKVDGALLPLGGTPLLSVPVRVIEGIHTDRTGTVNAVTWETDEERREVTDTPLSYTIKFHDRYEEAVLAPDLVEPLPEWDRAFTVIHVGEQLPDQWSACVLVAAPGDDSWQQQAVGLLRQGWRNTGRLVVLLPSPRDGALLQPGHVRWVETAAAWADAILTPEEPSTDAGPRLVERLPGRGDWLRADAARHGARLSLTSAPGTTVPGSVSWAHRHRVPVHTDLDAAVAQVLDRIGRGAERSGGARHMPLPVYLSPGFFGWLTQHVDERPVLAGAEVEWTEPGALTEDTVAWSAVRVRLRHRDHSITEHRLLSHPGRLSLVIHRRRDPWTESEVLLVPATTNGHGPHTALLDLPSFPIRHIDDGGAPVGLTDRAWALLAEEFGLYVTPHLLNTLPYRSDSPLVHTRHSVVAAQLTDEQFAALAARLQTAPVGELEIHRVVDLLAEPVCDWGTVGAITAAVNPRPLAQGQRSAPFRQRRERNTAWRQATRRAHQVVTTHLRVPFGSFDYLAVRDTIAMVLYCLHVVGKQPVTDVPWEKVPWYLRAGEDELIEQLSQNSLSAAGHDTSPDYYGQVVPGVDHVADRYRWLTRTWNPTAPLEPSDAVDDDRALSRPNGSSDRLRWGGLQRHAHVKLPDPAIELFLPEAFAAVAIEVSARRGDLSPRQRVRVAAGPYEGQHGYVHQPLWHYDDREKSVAADPVARYEVDLDDTAATVHLDAGCLAPGTDDVVWPRRTPGSFKEAPAPASDPQPEDERPAAHELEALLARCANPANMPDQLRDTIAAAVSHCQCDIDLQACSQPSRVTWRIVRHDVQLEAQAQVTIWTVEITKHANDPAPATYLALDEQGVGAILSRNTGLTHHSWASPHGNA
ncbi:hypothetical protein [Kitasatospora sp. NPDC001095]